jgi:hypothetical protein
MAVSKMYETSSKKCWSGLGDQAQDWAALQQEQSLIEK